MGEQIASLGIFTGIVLRKEDEERKGVTEFPADSVECMGIKGFFVKIAHTRRGSKLYEDGCLQR